MDNSLTHYGILGMRWGIRRTPEQLGRRDAKWVRRKGAKVTAKVEKAVRKDISRYERTELSSTPMRNRSGQISRTYLNQYNKKLAELMNERVGDIQAPSGKVIRYVAKRGEIGVHTALADVGYNMNQVRNGVNAAGRIAYKQEVLKRG